MSNFTDEEIKKAKAYYAEQARLMRPIPTYEDIEKHEQEKKEATNGK